MGQGNSHQKKCIANVVVKNTTEMTMLMMLAFLIDPVQQLCCKVYQQARKHIGTLRRLFEKIQHRIDIAAWDNWHHLLTCIGDPAS